MTDPYVVKPDGEFLRRVLDEGGEDVKKCYQCATCSVVCDLSKGRGAFPRKEMLWTQWGLKDRLMADPDVWACHQCNDCSTRCPRGARPGDVLAALRQQSVFHYSMPKFLVDWTNNLKYLPLMLLIPAVLLGLVLAVRGPLGDAIGLEEHEKDLYAWFFPHWLLITFFSGFAGLTTLAAALGVFRFWNAMKAADAAQGHATPKRGIVPAAINVVKSLFTHEKFGQCTANSSRKVAHMAAFYGFVALFIVTIWAVIDLYLMPLINIDAMYPFGLLHPMKILANVGCLALIYGCVRAILDRLNNAEESGKSTAFDWIFVGLLLAVAVTGLLTEVSRFVAEPDNAEELGQTFLQNAAFGIYFIHLVLVFDLLICLPFSKFAHVMYRTVALVYAEHSGRNE